MSTSRYDIEPIEDMNRYATAIRRSEYHNSSLSALCNNLRPPFIVYYFADHFDTLIIKTIIYNAKVLTIIEQVNFTFVRFLDTSLSCLDTVQNKTANIPTNAVKRQRRIAIGKNVRLSLYDVGKESARTRNFFLLSTIFYQNHEL